MLLARVSLVPGKEPLLIKDAFYGLGSELFAQGSRFSPDPQDVMLASYPKSGNTWVRALVAHLVGAKQSLREMERLIPDIYTSRANTLRNAYRFPCSGRLIKSHESFRPTYKRVIYLVRDPRDVCVSYYHYLANILPTVDANTTSVDAFAKMFVSGGLDDFGTWGEHTNSWLAAESADLLILRYEDLLAEAPQSLTRVCEFLGLDKDASEIATAVESCSLERLRLKEERERKLWLQIKNAKGAATFFRKGGSDGRADLNSASLELICEKWREPMRALNYLTT